MPQKRQVTGTLIQAAIFILLEVAAISMLKSSSSLQTIWINRLSHKVLAATWGSGENIRNYFSLRKQNDVLAEENRQLAIELDRYRNAIPQEQLESAYVNGEKSVFRHIPATIVKMSRNNQHNYVIINKGSADGVLPQSGIITNNGVVGIITSVDTHYSYGLSFQNSKTSVSARIGRDGVVSSLFWDGISSNKAKMNDIPAHIEIHKGDSLWTSGFSSVFPGDILLGTICSVREKSGSKSITVELRQDFSSLRYVTVVTNSCADEITKLEKNASDQR